MKFSSTGDYRRYSLDWLQGRLGVIHQGNPMFSGTLMDNIRYGRLDATDSEVIEVWFNKHLD